MNTAISPGGGKLLSCDLDEACPVLDCHSDLDEYAPTLRGSPDSVDVVAYYCGLDYLGEWPPLEEKH